jgi:glycosyltransferase involved in cell wall biosynthesis
MLALTEGAVVRSTSTPTSIAFLLDYAPKNWCSREDYHAGLCQALASRGIRAILVFAKDLPADVAATFKQKNIETRVIDYGKGFAHYHEELGRVIRDYSVSVVHICYFDYFSAIAWMARVHGVKTIIYEAVNSGSFNATSLKKVLLNVRTRLMTWPLTRIIAISDFVKQQLISGGVDPAKIDVRYLGVDNHRFSPAPEGRTRLVQEFNIDPNKVILTTVSFLNPFKNPQTLIEACGLLAKRGFRFHLFVAGDGVLRQQLENLSQKLGIADRICWLGHFADPRRLFQGSDIFALASVGEAFGFVLPEAMACGLPVVASRSGGIVEIVKDGETGLLVQPMNPEAFAEALRELVEKPELRATLGAQGMNRVAESFTLKAVVENTMKIYDSMNVTKRFIRVKLMR